MYMSKWNKSLFIPEAGQISKNILLAPVPDFVDVPCLLLRWSAVLMCVCVCVCVLCGQDFCHGQVMWPPLNALQVKLAEPGRSCKQVCQEEQLICEPSFFQHLNKDKDLAR